LINGDDINGPILVHN